MLGVFGAHDGRVQFLVFQQVFIIGVSGRAPGQVLAVFQVPGPRVGRRAQFRAQRHRVGAARPHHLRVGVEQFHQVVDVHVGKSDNAEAIFFRHGVLREEFVGSFQFRSD